MPAPPARIPDAPGTIATTGDLRRDAGSAWRPEPACWRPRVDLGPAAWHRTQWLKRAEASASSPRHLLRLEREPSCARGLTSRFADREVGLHAAQHRRRAVRGPVAIPSAVRNEPFANPPAPTQGRARGRKSAW